MQKVSRGAARERRPSVHLPHVPVDRVREYVPENRAAALEDLQTRVREFARQLNTGELPRLQRKKKRSPARTLMPYAVGAVVGALVMLVVSTRGGRGTVANAGRGIDSAAHRMHLCPRNHADTEAALPDAEPQHEAEPANVGRDHDFASSLSAVS